MNLLLSPLFSTLGNGQHSNDPKKKFDNSQCNKDLEAPQWSM